MHDDTRDDEGRHNFRKQRGGNEGGSGGDISFRKL